MSTYVLNDKCGGIVGINKVTLNDATDDIPISIRLNMHQGVLADFHLEIEASGIGFTELGTLLRGFGNKMIADQYKFEEEHHTEPPC